MRQAFPPANVTNPTREQQTLTAIDVATGANPEGVMARAVVWATTLAACAFILFVIYGGFGRKRRPAGIPGAMPQREPRCIARCIALAHHRRPHSAARRFRVLQTSELAKLDHTFCAWDNSR
jgi:hypothetical protein